MYSLLFSKPQDRGFRRDNELFIQNMPLIEAVGYNVIEVNNAVSANNKLGVQPSNGMLLFNPRIV